MNTPNRLHECASDLAEAARAFHAAAGEPGSSAAAADSLTSLEEGLQVLSAAWYQLAADGSPGPQLDGLCREQEVRLMGTLHDVAAAFARAARACREAQSTVTADISRRAAGNGVEFPRFQRHERPSERVA